MSDDSMRAIVADPTRCYVPVCNEENDSVVRVVVKPDGYADLSPRHENADRRIERTILMKTLWTEACVKVSACDPVSVAGDGASGCLPNSLKWSCLDVTRPPCVKQTCPTRWAWHRTRTSVPSGTM